MEGERNISLHFYYFMTGWYYSDTLRRNEKVRYPSFYGANLVWTEGDSAPYKVMYHFFNYPIGIKEKREKQVKRTKNLSHYNLIYDKEGRVLKNNQLRRGVYFIKEKNQFRKIIKF